MKTLESLRDIQLRLLDIVKDVDAFCRQNGLRYSLAYGTLLGAVRHKGFIPWDDDLDIMMPRPDFEVFVATYGKDPASPYRCLYNTRGKEEYFVNFFAKVHDTRTVSIEARMPSYRFGLNIDVFPIDGKPSTGQAAFEKECSSIIHRIYLRQRPFFPWSLHDPLLPKIEAHAHSLDYWIEKINSRMLSFSYSDSQFRGALPTRRNGTKEVFPKEVFDSFRDIEFEGETLMSIQDPDRFLRQVFGEDYMTPPPEGKRKTHSLTVYLKD
ncbi:MAG: LicD family protein [Candidatus Cryptobacteroides sp.]|nr:LicD family protein [Candidatus Cryptobacteroides sp.]